MTSSEATKDIYLSAVVEQTPRLLGLLNRNSSSDTYGCFDRSYWHYRILDTPSARCQEAVLTLALLHEIPGTAYSGKEALVTWAKAALNFWLKLQQTNGSFNEWYPHENSFVATAFSSYAVSEAVLLLGSKVLDNYSATKDGLIKAGQWLIGNGEGRALNQFVGSALALYNIFLVTNDKRFEKEALARVASLQKLQSAEGWFAEYGGADIGYLSLTIAYLAKLYRKSQWTQVLDLTLLSMEFIKTFLHRNLTSGGEYSSRLTEYLIPDGFEILARESRVAGAISLFVRDALKREKGVSIFSFDDRYLTYVGYNFLEAFNYGTSDVRSNGNTVGTLDKPGIFRDFSQAGPAVINNKQFEGVVNTRRGGAFKFTFDNGVTISDCGIVLLSNQGRFFYSGFWSEQVERVVDTNKVLVRGRFGRVRDTSLSPWRNILFRAFLMTVGRMGQMSFRLKNFLRDFLIMRPSREEIYYEREIEVKDDLICIRDKISSLFGRLQVKKIVLGARDSFLYTPSSKFFNPTDLDEKASTVLVTSHLGTGNRIEISRLYASDGELLDLRVTES